MATNHSLIATPPATPGVATADRRDPTSRDALVRRVRVQYEELPALRLTEPQARRVFAMREDVCARVLGALVRRSYLRRDCNGAFVRRDCPDWPSDVKR
jgi:hypothetical protein